MPLSRIRLFRNSLPLAALLALAGCSTFTFDYRALAGLAPEGDDFNAELAREYQAFAHREADAMMDWIDAAHFGTKAFAADRGETPAPETPAAWRLPAEAEAPIADGHGRLMAVLVKGAREDAPLTAARTQARFDCWIEQQEEGWQLDEIAACRDGFYAGLNELEERFILSPQPRLRTDVTSPDASAPTAVSPAAEATSSQVSSQVEGTEDGVSQPDTPAPRIFTVFFPFDSATLDDGGRAVVAAIAEQVQQGTSTGLIVAGHADRAGSEAYNLRLSQRRAEAVARALQTFGVPERDIAIQALGETTPLVATGDGVREAKNRRVEITATMP